METPRRRSQNREEQPQEQTEQVGLDSAQNCMNAVAAMKRELSSAKKTLINSENCVVNRNVLQAQLEYLERNLPGTVRKAAEIVQAEETIRTETEESRKRILGEAQARADAIEADAKKQAHEFADQVKQEASEVMERANQEASACVEAARAEAARMLEDAEKKARQMIEEETVVRRARVESEELREKTQQEMAQLRKNAIDFVDQQLVAADRNVSELLNAIRMERNEVRNHR
ncbi:MAG: hypothetical protein II888_03025 [Clostridia bacterium]|nr:hypothetical protein [Clostridia bacterium]